ncbi:pyruvate dehydrogenase E2 component (dihydrolipoamide acetyltransferase) [Faunimonas pinastri]|uniref:Acetyltransferase component of pyruvate dehydrogenase complex n=1 Tax=Faunimonas pinastri TaxID=1855383 RepID=A0A1H9N9I4_9HYPH|nr:pyruvate dehydrogenase complex dihydrolipoamide acetyltransferase [Faunimonas pinastri]SER32053.1 pyruvate dehydrogenase E2 component (dihydrolipoamide acetyltransferase) [Faunimonas pinastri]
MPINILMPALSPTMEKGNLAKWHVKEGDKVSSGDVIAEIETDKATMEVEAVDEGTMAKILVQEGAQDVPVNEIIAMLAGEGEDASAVQAPASGSGKAEQAQPTTDTSKEPAPAVAEKGEAQQGDAAVHDQKPAAAGAGNSAQGEGQGRAPSAPAQGQNGARVFASPLARRLAKENGLDLSQVSGTGPHGRIVKNDVDNAVKQGTGKAPTPQAGAAAQPQAGQAPATQPPAAAPAVGMSDEQIRKLFLEGSYEVVPHDSMRKTIARRLTEAKSTIPHFYVTTDCDIGELLKLRGELNSAAPMGKDDKPTYKISVNDMVIKALAMALQAVPDANVTWTGEGMLKHKRSDVGVAVSIPNGLITPVVRNAETKTLSAISNEMKDLAKRARDRKLKPDEYQGGTTAVSNLGMYGVKDFAAIVNPPHATILAVGAGEERAVVKGGQIVVANIMSVTLSTDHRAVDGALGAEFLRAFKRFIEHPMSMLV